ncbi:SDR family oxidoreductase [Rhizobium leguminosarum]|uniref:SDR family oxidoreductase n=1 Tax=Rhizobium leguminosarum TaxID=384 RepID=UPI0003F8B2F5|nr:SDR family oxidoreductase [Rhizobium leguminosarum]MBY5917943.1 SDR family oxidoreductase [Rhizobium leguminosarum]TBE55529.1 SDR family oxidoreductase [Rhizobium leguminosarum]TBE93104.1 SDR family oxidoreductase [Rhizobium leguminosarum]TBZ98081.1 SDR family oxidoreductase [Rhizobium leguminosarum bv. viciae]UIJ85227.1 SDR family oxidoreductase [Rhizobium leguminosarum]
MNILILGATGFIGSVVAARLVADGHVVTGLGRNPVRARLKQPAIEWRRADLSRMTKPADWEDILKDQHVVVNCAGALQDGLSDDLAATQAEAMLALYAAAKCSSRQLIVQISARTAGAAGDLPFLATKRRADEALAASGLPYLILRPALVLGRNAHGGSALLRALAAFPLALPLVHAESPVETLSVDDVAEAVSRAVSGGLPSKDIDLAANEVLTLADLSGLLGWRSPLRSTALTVMSEGVQSSKAGSLLVATPAAAALSANPSGVQDLWFARLYLLKPLVISGLSVFWLLSGLIPLLALEKTSAHFLPFMPQASATALTLATCLTDVVLGAAVLVRPLAKRALVGMLGVSLAYLAGASLLEPALWLDPLGVLVKVLPSILLTLVALATLDER